MLGMCDMMAQLPKGATLRQFEERVGHELGVVRISLGLASDFRDVWRVIRFAGTLGNEQARTAMLESWMTSSQDGHH